MSAQRDRFDIGCNILGIHAGDQSCQQQGKTPLQGKKRHGYGEGVAEGNVLDWHSDHTQESTLAPEMCSARRKSGLSLRRRPVDVLVDLSGRKARWLQCSCTRARGTRQAWRFKPHHQWKWRRVLKISMHTYNSLTFRYTCPLASLHNRLSRQSSQCHPGSPSRIDCS